MEIAMLIMFVILTLICFIGVLMGLHPKRLVSWIFGLCGFLGGISIGIIASNITGGIELGLLYGVATMFGGFMIYWHRQRYGKQVIPWLSRYGHIRSLSLLSRFMKEWHDRNK